MASPTRAGASSIADMLGAWDVDRLSVEHLQEGRLGDAVLDVFANARPGLRLMKLADLRMPGRAGP